MLDNLSQNQKLAAIGFVLGLLTVIFIVAAR